MTEHPGYRPNGPTDETGQPPPPLPAYVPPASPSPVPEADAELRARAAKSLADRKDFTVHLTVYWVVMAFLVVIWLVTAGWGSYFWPIWPMLGWGLGLVLHGLSLTWDQEPTEDQIEAEARRIAQKRGQLPPGSTPSD